MIPGALNVISQLGNVLVVCIISGQLFSALSPKLDTTLGVVIAGLGVFVVSVIPLLEETRHLTPLFIVVIWWL
jgi:hypothetical protein